MSSSAPQREGRVAAAVVELDALPDAVGPAAQNEHLRSAESRQLLHRVVRRFL